METLLAEHGDLPLKLLWIRGGFHNPECAVLDASTDKIYLANQAASRDVVAVGQGYISCLSVEGELLEEKWTHGLRNPMGLILRGRTLHVVDLDRVRVFDLATAKQMHEHLADGATYLDGVTIHEIDGTIFVSDFMASAIWRLHDGKFEKWLADPRLDHPDGMVAEAGRLVVGVHGLWEGVRQWTSEVAEDRKGHLLAIDFETKSIEDMYGAVPIAHHDGLTSDGAGGYITADFVYNSLIHIDRSGSTRMICRFSPSPLSKPMVNLDVMARYGSSRGPADIRYYPERQLLLVPFVASGELAALEFAPPSLD